MLNRTPQGGRQAPAPWRVFAWSHPEWWMLATWLAACAALLMSTAGPASWALCTGAPSTDVSGTLHRIRALVLSGAMVRMAAGSLLMTLAMMLPLIILPVRHAAFRSPWRRRHRAAAGVVLGYVAVWT